MTNAEESTIISADRAHTNYEKTLRVRSGLEGGFIALGMLLQESQRDSLYKFLGYDTFNEYLGAPELGFHRSTAYKLIGLINLFVDKLKVPESRLITIGSTNLNAIAKVVEGDVEGWLDKAEHLSKSSLNEEIDGAVPGVKVSPPVGRPTTKPSASPSSPLAPCAICGESPTEKSHFPITIGAGADREHWVPMCRSCHDDFHAGPETFILNYKRNWGEWFFNHLNRGE